MNIYDFCVAAIIDLNPVVPSFTKVKDTFEAIVS